ncbi:cysteine synthase A [Oscillospiraceae bacterium HV4-5-C5C]|nr:cysteine synthase A [Oscillospiraceae bacterium HV4-5-C5C]
MGKIYDDMSQWIGHTPLQRLHRIETACQLQSRLLAKIEFVNPAGSVKDRIARQMLDKAEASGQLQPGATIVEATSGNTGIGLAALGASRGYKVILVMPDYVSQERILMLRGYGADIVLTPGELNMPGAGQKAAAIAAGIPGSFVPGQGANPQNVAAHYQTTGPEIWQDTEGDIDVFVACVGTGGTLTGAGSYLREKKPALEIVAVEPAGCPVLSGGQAGPHKIQGIGGGMIPPILQQDLYREILQVTDEAAFYYARLAARLEGLSVGLSSGAALAALVHLARRAENRGRTLLTLFPDSGERYLSADIYPQEPDLVTTTAQPETAGVIGGVQ